MGWFLILAFLILGTSRPNAVMDGMERNTLNATRCDGNSELAQCGMVSRRQENQWNISHRVVLVGVIVIGGTGRKPTWILISLGGDSVPLMGCNETERLVARPVCITVANGFCLSVGFAFELQTASIPSCSSPSSSVAELFWSDDHLI